MSRLKLSIESAGATDLGLSRPNNEDVWAVSDDLQFYVIADGMGGHSAGEIAARQAVDHLLLKVKNYLKNPQKSNTQGIKAFLKDAMIDTNRAIYDLAAENPDWDGMGTTLSCCLFWEQVLIYAHVGDSRIYRYRGEMLDQLTTDHTVRQYTKNFISKAIGTLPQLDPDVHVLPILADDIYILCTDGLSDILKSKEICLILRKTESAQEAANCLVQAAKNQGGGDNITAIVVQLNA